MVMYGGLAMGQQHDGCKQARSAFSLRFVGDWCRGNIPALGAGDRGFESRIPPTFFAFLTYGMVLGDLRDE